jgi:acetyltransferase-like isoleucine patch superfamily enzyme
VPQENVNDQFAILVGWLVGDAQPVTAGQSVAELETSKAVFDIRTESGGILVYQHSLGDEIPVGDVVALVLSPEEFAARGRAAAAPVDSPLSDTTSSATTEAVPAESPPPVSGAVRATPGARKLAASLGIDLASITTRGFIREKDVLVHKAASATTAARTVSPPIEPPKELLGQWKIRDPVKPVAGGWLLYSREFLTRILGGGYSCKTDVSVRTKCLLPVVTACVAVAQSIVWLLAKLPFVGTWVEILARIYRRNLFGFFLRGAYYRARLARLGQDNIIDQHVEIWGARHVSIGKGCHLDMYARLAAGEESQSQQGRIEIEDHVHIGPQCQLAGRGGIFIGSYTAVTAGTKVFSATNVGESPDDPYDLLPMSHAAPLDRQRIFQAPVRIGDHVFIGLNSCILPGVTIGRGAIINSGSVITRDVPEFAIMGGNPARVQGYRTPRVRPSPAVENQSPGVA